MKPLPPEAEEGVELASARERAIARARSDSSFPLCERGTSFFPGTTGPAFVVEEEVEGGGMITLAFLWKHPSHTLTPSFTPNQGSAIVFPEQA